MAEQPEQLMAEQLERVMTDDAPQPEAAILPDDGGTQRGLAERLADHASLSRLADDLLPALMGKLGASGLGELEVREGRWRLRLRRPHAVNMGRRHTDRAARSQPGHEGHGHAPAALEPQARVRHSTNGTDPGEPITAERQPGRQAQEERREVATSPAVGLFKPGLAPGAKVRAGDRVAVVDMLGVAHDVLSPVDGTVGATLVDAGDAVEFGEPLVVVDRAEASRPTVAE